MLVLYSGLVPSCLALISRLLTLLIAATFHNLHGEKNSLSSTFHTFLIPIKVFISADKTDFFFSMHALVKTVNEVFF